MKSPNYNVLDNIQNYFSFRFISQTIIIILLIGSTSLYSQIANDFIIADSGSVPSIKSDLNDGIYIAWQNLNDAVPPESILISKAIQSGTPSNIPALMLQLTQESLSITKVIILLYGRTKYLLQHLSLILTFKAIST